MIWPRNFTLRFLGQPSPHVVQPAHHLLHPDRAGVTIRGVVDFTGKVNSPSDPVNAQLRIRRHAGGCTAGLAATLDQLARKFRACVDHLLDGLIVHVLHDPDVPFSSTRSSGR